MPEKSGYDTAPLLRPSLAFSGRIAAVSAFDDEPQARQQAGIDFYEAKPLTRTKLAAWRARRHLSAKHLSQAYRNVSARCHQATLVCLRWFPNAPSVCSLAKARRLGSLAISQQWSTAMIGRNLLLHRGARLVERADLDRVEAPAATETWFPLKHGAVLDTAIATLEAAGFGVVRTELALSRGDMRFFGTLTLANRVTDDCSLTVGVRNSIDKSFPIGFAVGERVFVCDNLAFSSEIVIARKHTRFGETRFQEAVSQAVVALPDYQSQAGERIKRLQAWELTPDEADALLLRSFEQGLVSIRHFADCIRAWREPAYEDFRPRTGWSLLNSVTGVLKERQRVNPQAAAAQTIALQRLIAPPLHRHCDASPTQEPIPATLQGDALVSVQR